MDEILKKLSEIEESAGRILDRTSEQKAAVAAEMKQKTEEYDRRMEEETQQKINEVKEQLKAQREADLASLRTSTQQQLESMESAFARKHTELAKKIMNRIVEA